MNRYEESSDYERARRRLAGAGMLLSCPLLSSRKYKVRLWVGKWPGVTQEMSERAAYLTDDLEDAVRAGTELAVTFAQGLARLPQFSAPEVGAIEMMENPLLEETFEMMENPLLEG